MKNRTFLVFGLACLALCLTACKGGGGGVNTEPMKTAFQSAPPNTKTEVDQAARAIESGDFKAAADALQKAVQAKDLTPEQKAAVAEVVAEMQRIAAQDPEKYPMEVYYDIGDVISVMEGLPKRGGVPPTPNVMTR